MSLKLLRDKDHNAFIYSIVQHGIRKRKHFIEMLRKNNRFDGMNTSIMFSGKNNNENGSVQVLEYSKTN